MYQGRGRRGKWPLVLKAERQKQRGQTSGGGDRPDRACGNHNHAQVLQYPPNQRPYPQKGLTPDS
eukprot:7000504-Prorocentrum_lima.AAC.1